MLDVGAAHAFAACIEFAVRWLDALAHYDLPALEAMVDVSDSGGPLAESLPRPEGFTYARAEQAEGWSVHFGIVDDGGFAVDFEVPFAEKHYRCGIAMFEM